MEEKMRKLNTSKSLETEEPPIVSDNSEIAKCEVDSLLTDLPHSTSITADHGHVYQRELFFYFCLKFHNSEYTNWKIGFEVSDSKKFDDIVAEFENQDRKYSYLMQSKHDSTDEKVVTFDNLLSTCKPSKRKAKANLDSNPTETQPSGTQKKSNYNMSQYHEAVTSERWSQNRFRKFMILTNQELDLTVPTSRESVPKSVQETDTVFWNIFQELKNFNDSINATKFLESFKTDEGKLIDDKYFLDNFIFVSNLPNIQDLTTYNNSILEEIYKGFKIRHVKTIRDNVFKSLEVERIADKPYQRSAMTQDKLLKIIQNSILEIDFPSFSSDFINQFPEWLNFSGDAFEEFNTENIQYYCKENAKLLTYMLYKKISEQEEESKSIFCISFSKLTDIYRESLKVFQHKVVVYVDHWNPEEDFSEYRNAKLVFQIQEENSEMDPQCTMCSFSYLTQEAKEAFWELNIQFQGHNVPISKIGHSEVLTEILQVMFDNREQVEFGTKLPISDLPKYYIDRSFTVYESKDKKEIREDEIYEEGTNVVIQGLAGVGKSSAMLNIARKIKKINPEVFVKFIDLKEYSHIFKEIKDNSSKQHSNNMIEDAWKFVTDHFLVFDEKKKAESKIEKMLIEGYLKEYPPKIMIFLDGFDEISPLYSDLVIDIVEGLKEENVQMFISTQSHLIHLIEKLEFDKIYTLKPYDENMQRQFLRYYWGYHLEKMINGNKIQRDEVEPQNIHAYTKKFFKMCYKSKLTDITPSIPLILNILADIYINECIEFCKKTKETALKDILEVDVLMVYEKIFQHNSRKFYKKTQENAANVFIVQRETEGIETIRELYMKIAAEKLLHDFWHLEECQDIKKNQSEIYGRGFITGNTTDEYIFIYPSFEEFFAADWLARKVFPEDILLNFELFKSLLQKDTKKDKIFKVSKGVTSFLYRLMLKKLKEKKDKLSMECQKEEIKQISEFTLGFFHYAWFNKEVEHLEITFDLATTFCSKEAVTQICKEKKLLETVPFTSSKQLDLSLQVYDYYFGHNVTKDIIKERNMEKILNLIIKNTNFQLFEKYFQILTDRNIISKEEYVTKTYKHFRDYLKKQKLSTWMFARDMLMWFYDNLNMTEENILNEMDEILKEEKFQERHFLGHSLAAFWDWKENNDSFLQAICSQIEVSKNYYKFMHALNSITREDILEKSIEVMRQNGCSFVCHDGKSVLCHAFEENNNYMVTNLLKFFTNVEVLAQIDDEVCGGNSITKQCTKENLICEIFIKYMLNTFGDDKIQKFYTPVEDGREESSIKNNINFLNTIFVKQIDIEDGTLNNFVKHFCDDVLEYEKRTGKQINLTTLAKEVKCEKIRDYILEYPK